MLSKCVGFTNCLVSTFIFKSIKLHIKRASERLGVAQILTVCFSHFSVLLLPVNSG